MHIYKMINFGIISTYQWKIRRHIPTAVGLLASSRGTSSQPMSKLLFEKIRQVDRTRRNNSMNHPSVSTKNLQHFAHNPGMSLLLVPASAKILGKLCLIMIWCNSCRKIFLFPYKKRIVYLPTMGFSWDLVNVK